MSSVQEKVLKALRAGKKSPGDIGKAIKESNELVGFHLRQFVKNGLARQEGRGAYVPADAPIKEGQAITSVNRDVQKILRILDLAKTQIALLESRIMTEKDKRALERYRKLKTLIN